MSQKLRMASEFYRIARGRKPAAKMMFHVAMALAVLIAWASMTPVSDIAVGNVKIVPKNGSTQIKNGSLNLSTSLSGKVASVLVREKQEVVKGDVLVRLDTSDFQVRRNGELEKIKNLQGEINARTSQIELATETVVARNAELVAQMDTERQRIGKSESERSIKIELARSELNRTAKELSRSRNLIAKRAISKTELDAAEGQYNSAKEKFALASLPVEGSRVSELQSRLESVDTGHAELVQKIKTEQLALESQISLSRSELELLELRIENCEIISPIDGQVSACNLTVGDWVSPGELQITVSQTGFIAEVLLPSQSVSSVKAGDRATIMLDGIDWLVNGSLGATVTSISPELCHEEVAMGDGSTQVVDGYRVLLNLESGNFRKWDSIRIGMTGSVQIETGKKRLAIYLLEQSVGNALFKTR